MVVQLRRSFDQVVVGEQSSSSWIWTMAFRTRMWRLVVCEVSLLHVYTNVCLCRPGLKLDQISIIYTHNLKCNHPCYNCQTKRVCRMIATEYIWSEGAKVSFIPPGNAVTLYPLIQGSAYAKPHFLCPPTILSKWYEYWYTMWEMSVKPKCSHLMRFTLYYPKSLWRAAFAIHCLS